jgi:hypothetical protein
MGITFTIHAKYLVSPHYHKSKEKEFDSLAEAKRYGIALAKKFAWEGKYSVTTAYISIYHRISPNILVEYLTTHYPVRGSGVSAKEILYRMKERGIPQGKWVPNKNYKRACARLTGKPYEHL